MSSIMDGLIGLQYRKVDKMEAEHEKQCIIYELSKKVNNSNGCLIFKNHAQNIQTSLRVEQRSQQYTVQIIGDKELACITLIINQLHHGLYNKIQSRNLQVSIMNTLTSVQYLRQNPSIIYLHQGRISMKLKISFLKILKSKKMTIDFYNQIIIKNIEYFHSFLTMNFKEMKEIVDERDKEREVYSDISLSLILSKTDSNFDYSPDKSKIKLSQTALRRQKIQIKSIEDAIICQKGLQNISKLFNYHSIEATSQWLKENITFACDNHTRKYKNSLEIPTDNERRKNQSNINILKIELKDQYKKLLAEGGSSLIYCAKFMITLANKEERASLFEEKIEKIQKTLVIKSLKPEFQKIFREKLEHQKQIVLRFHHEHSYFLPKYYNTEKQSQLNRSIVMEYINGQELDSFFRSRYYTISFRTKIYILLNIIFGLRHLTFHEIVHLDIKPINIMVTRQLIPKIIDYGEAFHKDICPKNYTPGFTFPYVAPQVYSKFENQIITKRKQELPYSEKQDAFAFGMIIYEALFNCKPFNYNIKKYKEIYADKNIADRLFIAPERLESYQDEYLMSALIQNIAKCLHCDPENRPRIDWIGILLKIILSQKNR